METHSHPGEHAHPSPRKYVSVALILALITAAEVGIYYIEALSDSLLVAFLLFFAVIKFAMVAAWFMHLKFDSRMFRRLFITGLVLAGVVFAIVLTTFFARGGPSPLIGG